MPEEIDEFDAVKKACMEQVQRCKDHIGGIFKKNVFILGMFYKSDIGKLGELLIEIQKAENKEAFKEIVMKVDQKSFTEDSRLIDYVKRCFLRMYGIKHTDIDKEAEKHCDSGTLFEAAHYPELRLPQERAVNALCQKIINNEPITGLTTVRELSDFKLNK